ncbi:MAG: DUF2934 domain-containing protein [Candidatus Korobacteraceae bacterium]
MAKEKNSSDKSAPKKTAAKKSPDKPAAAAKKAAVKKPAAAEIAVATAAPASPAMPASGGAAGHRAQPSAAQLYEEIRLRAYQLYCERGGEHGSHEADWHRAELEVRSKHR